MEKNPSNLDAEMSNSSIEIHEFVDDWMLDCSYFYDHNYTSESVQSKFNTIGNYCLFGDLNSQFRIMTYGGSTTSSIVGSKWVELLQKNLQENDFDSHILNGGCGGHNSWHELNKIIRDATSYKPTHIISFSGINDFWNQVYPKHPYLYPRMISTVLGENGKSKIFPNGYIVPLTKDTHADAWINKSLAMHGFCKSLGIKFYRILQPTLGVGNYIYDLEDDLDARLHKLMTSDIKGKGVLYRKKLSEYYAELRTKIKSYPFIVDMSQVFDGGTRLFSDHRHPNFNGYAIIARSIAKLLLNDKAKSS